MPQYEYLCKSCEKKFSTVLTLAEHEKGKVKCPKYGGTKVEQQWAAFFATTSKKSWAQSCLKTDSWYKRDASMNHDEFKASLVHEEPPNGLSAPLMALWWDAKQDWTRAHALVDELETTGGMAVHAYLHRKGGQASNAEYWYERAGRRFRRTTLDEEWGALVDGLLSGADEG
jgi:putative FmdB family regulatory protein